MTAPVRFAIAGLLVLLVVAVSPLACAPDPQPVPEPDTAAVDLEYRTKAAASRAKKRDGRPALTVQQRSKRYAKQRVKPGQWPCLRRLWHHESRWNHRAHNTSSGAYGIPQALPGHKMRAAGRDWKTNPRTQIRWGVHRYIGPRYGTPCAAWQHFQNRNWY